MCNKKRNSVLAIKLNVHFLLLLQIKDTESNMLPYHTVRV